MTQALVAGLLGYQSATGAFGAIVQEPQASSRPDETCLITAQICLILLSPGLAGRDPLLQLSLERGLSFIESCAAPEGNGWFRMHATMPPNAALPDLKTTALAWLALVLAGRREPQVARDALLTVIRDTEVSAPRPEDSAWIAPGLCRTWPTRGQHVNPVDLVANIHLAACRASLGLPLPTAAREAMTHASAALDPAGGNFSQISPMCASPAEVELALEQAVRAGQEALVPALRTVRQLGFGRRDRLARRPADRPLHCLPDGGTVWSAPSLQLARWLYDLSHDSRPDPRPRLPCP
ncbi:hypothetical protein [Salipiger mangrovisoli]|uniref:Uncharacterized protein n=1 Tax=Salipiger mangrovisoli TaxID=2865933 RepID=A0ABR9X0K9_9RHOB|nr:hypothetical protein [Salipiger mangrovisoli]MBE9637090.1 hypothetical protein [Salipiger mangrovisoli]